MSNFGNGQSDNEFLAGLKAEFEPVKKDSGNDFLSGLKEEFEPKKPQGFLSRVGDDLSNVGKAWKAGNFYSKGGWNDIAQNIINGGTPEEREVLFKNYLDWESKNQMPENKSWVGDVVNGVANLVPLTVDMLPEAATVGAATAAGGAALGSVLPGAGTVAGALGGLKLGVGSSMAEQSYKVGVADIYTSLRKDGVDDETAKNWAIWAGIPYGALEFAGKGVAPIQRKFLGGKVLKELIDKVSDTKIKNKILNAAAKYGADVALTGTLESAIEGGQGGITELARQGAKGEGYDVGKVASATWDEAAQAAPAMFGMAALGVPLEAATNFKTKRLQKDLENVQNAVEEGRKVVEVPAGVKLGEVFTGADGKAYKNVDGIAQPYVVKIKPEVSDTDNLDADAESDPYGKPAEKPVVRMGEDGRLYAQTGNVSEQLNADFSPENAAKYYQPFNARGEMLDAPIRTMAEDRIYAAEKAEAQKQAQQQQAMIEAQAELEMGRQKLQKKLDEINRKKNRVSAIAKKIAKIDNPDDRLQAMEFYIDVENGDASKLTEEQLYEASSHGFEWADAELSRRAQTENSGVPLLDIMRQDGIKLPTPQAIQRHADANGRGLGSYLYGEIRDLYYSLPKNLQLKYFTKNFVDLDTVAADMEQTHGIRYDSEGDFLADVAANLSGQKVSYGAFSLAEKDYAKMTDAELVEAHRKAESAKDYSAGFEIKKEWDKRRGYNTDVYHGTGADGFNVAKADASEAKNGEGAQAHGMGLYASGNKEVAKAYRGTAVYGKPYYSYWAKGEELSKGAKELGIRDVYFNDAMSKIADVGFARMKKDLEKEINKYAKEIEELDRRIAHWKEKARRSRTKYYDYMGYVESYSYDARKKEEYKQEAEGKLKLYQLVNDWLASKGISEKELEKRERSDGKLYNWRTNLAKENTLDEQLPFSEQSKEVQEKIKNAIESLTEEQLGGVSKEDALRDFIENNTDGGNIYDAFENYTGSKKNASKHLLKHGIRGITYDGRQDGRCYVSFEGGAAVKLQDAFTYDDDGKYIPLDKRSDTGNPDMRYSIGEGDAQRFKNELQDYIDGELDKRHVFKLGTTPEVMRLVGAEDLPVELSASVLERKEAKHSLILENLSNLPEELADPIAVMQSSTIPDAITLITELPTIDRHNMLVAVHLNKRFGKAEINSIRSIYPKTQSGLQTAIDRGELRYINTKRKPSWITLPFQHASGRKAIQRAYGHEVFTQADLSQAEKENIFKLRGEDKRHSYSISEGEKANQTKIDGIKAAVEDVRAKFNRRAKVKASVDIVGTLEEAREKLGAESIPYNARAVQDKERVVIIAENITDADEAVRIFLHELVGHWGVKKLFGTKADLKPFLNYIITHYQDSDAWKRVAKYYKDVTKNKYAIAEEVLAHVAENRELSDPSMWKRLVHRVKRELWGNGVPQEYVNLLNEDVLRSAIALSREWAKGDHYLNADGIWARIDSAPKGRDVPDEPDDGKRFSLIGENGMRNLENLGSRNASNPEAAKEMLARGETPSNIWRKTGWFKNPKDGKWRFELDNGEIINAPFEENSNQLLPNVLDDEDLYSAYPSLRDRWVAFRNIANGGAYFDGKNFYVDNSFADRPKGLREILIHEIQHSIQIEEGFARGANEAMFTSEDSKLLDWKIEEVSREYDDLQAERKRVSKESGLSDKIREIADDEDFVGKYEKLLEKSGVKDVLAELDDKIFEKGNELWKLEEERNNEESGLSPHEKYMRVAGEVEARNAAARQMQLSPDMRRKISPEATQDIPFDKQIIGRNDGMNYSLKERPTDAEIQEARRQKDEVKAKWTNPDGTMKKGYHCAPNGKESKLTEEQWLLVRTPNFKKWFGDWENAPENASKVVDENGEPLVVYHNTPNEFTVFKPSERGRYGAGVYATSNPEDSSYGENWNIMALFANARNLRNPTEKVPVEFLRKLQKQAEDYLLKNPPEVFVGKKEAMLDFYFGKNRNEIFQHSFGSLYWNNLRDILAQANKVFGSDFNIEADGFIIERDGGKWFNFFDRSQIKSATDNVGTYSENPDIRWSIREDSDAEKIDTQFSELYERYKNGDKAAYEEAAKLVADYAESKGYDVKVYHGTGADGFNVADASGKHFKNGEGMQAHGMGLYLATKRSTADKYRENADRPFVYTVKGIDATKLGFDDSSFDEDSLYELFWHAKTNGFDASIAETEKKISSRKEYIEEAKKSNLEGVSDLENALKNEEVRLKAFKQLKRIFNERGYTEADIDWHCKDGKVFDWFTNLKPNEVIDENKPLSEQPEIWKKFKNAWIDMWAYVKRKRKGKRYWESLNPDRLGKDGNRTAGFIFSRWSDEYGSAETINLLLRNGIYGIVYDGGLDGRCYVSFEGGSAVKLQDPFTFDDNGQLIPLSERFDEANPDMRYSLKEGTPENDKEYKQKRAREEIKSKAGRAVQAAVDAFAPLATLEGVLYGGVRGAEKSAWKMALMTRNLDQVMFHVLRVGGIKYNKADGSFVKREETKGLEEILKPVKGENYKNFEHYAKAKSAIERWGFLRKTNFFAGTDFYKTFGFSLEDAKKWVAEGSAVSKKAFGELQVFFQGQRDFMLETGLISPEQHTALSRFKNYVPFFREGADLDAETEAAYERFSEIFPAGKGFSGRNSGVEKFEGSARRTKNLVENIVNQSRKVMDSGYKNIAAYRSLNLMRELDMAKYVRSDSVDAQVKIAEMRRALETEGIEVGDISDEELLKKVPVEAYLKITDDSNDNIVSVRVNGTLRFYKVEDPELLVAVKNFGAEKVNVMWKLLTAPKNIMTQAITKTPEFAIRNFIRDTGSNTILFGGKTIAPYLAHTAKNAVKSAWNTADMQKVWAAGAGGGAWYSVKAEDIAADFKDGGKIQKIGKYTIKPLKWLLNEYERRILMPSEQGNRISVMQKALENGASDMEAAFQYLDVMNFGMRGSGVWTGKNEWAKGAFTALHAIIRITPFLNARIQGLYKLWRESGAQGAKFNAGEEFALKERTRAFVQSLSKAVLLRGMMMASASMLYSLYANSSTDDDGDKWFEKLPAHDKLNYWHIYLGNNNILRIPKPFEIGYIFGTIPESITDALIQKRPQTAKVLWEGLTSQLEFDPLSNPVIDTVREQYWNKDSFTKRPIIQQSDKDLKPRYQYDPDTSATAKAVARVFEGVGLDDSWLASPARIQNVIGNFLGGMTKYITAASDVIVEALTDIEGGTSRYARESATKRVYDWAVRNTKTMTTRNAEDYYELRNRVREIYGAVRVLRQEKRLEECQNLIDEHKGELGNYNLIEAVNTRLGEISRKRKALGADRTLSTEELIRADDELLAERNRLLADVDILIDRVEKGDFNARDMRDILKRIRNADREKRDSKKARARLRELANMR